jgi:serpin B
MSFLTQDKSNWKFILIVVILAVLVGGGIYWWQKSNMTITIPTPALTNNSMATSTAALQAANVVEANNRFSLDLYSKYSGQKNINENIFFSSFSISSAIAMTYEGAKGKTAQEILNVFHFPSDGGLHP